jgi:carboxylesterase
LTLGLVGEGDPSPITIDGRTPAVLAFHGFGGTPNEVALVAAAASELGLAARAPLLPGHGTSVEDLAQKRWPDWVAAAESELEAISTEPVIVCGLSLGSLLAAHLAAVRPERVLGLVMLANAAWLAAPSSWALAAVDRFGVRDFSLPKVTSDIADPEARRTHLTYPAQPVRAAVSVQRAGAIVREELPRVRCPVLIAHGARDRVCPVSNARRVFELLGSADKRLVILPRSRHIITRDLERQLLGSELRSFIAELAGPSRSQRVPVEP